MVWQSQLFRGFYLRYLMRFPLCEKNVRNFISLKCNRLSEYQFSKTVAFVRDKHTHQYARGCRKSWLLLRHPRELKIKSLYNNDLILNIASKSKEAVQKLKFSDSPLTVKVSGVIGDAYLIPMKFRTERR